MHIEDAPPLPVWKHRQEFLEFVQQHDLGEVPPFYSAYPTLTVGDIRTLAREAEAAQP